MKKNFIAVFCIFLSIILAGCGDKDSENASNNQNSNANKSETNKAITNILDWEVSDFKDGEQRVIQFDEMVQPDIPISSFAHNGAFVIRGNHYSYFYDYENGKISPFAFSGTGDARINNDIYSDTHLFSSYYYVVEPNRSEGTNYLVEANVNTGEEKHLLQVSDAVQLSKDGDILYVANNDKLIALDTKQGEEVWEVELDTALSFTRNKITDNLVVLLGDEGLAAYSRTDGKKLYEVKGYFYDLATDGDTYYVAEESEKTFTDFKTVIFNVLKFTGQSEEAEHLFETPKLLQPNEDDDFHFDMVGNMLYVKTENALIAYDKNKTSPSWILAVGEELLSEKSVSEPSYEFKTDYTEDKVYIRATKWDHGAEETLFMSADAKTGEMINNLRIDEGETIGPNVDGDQAVIFRKVEDENPEIYIMTE